MPKSSMYEGLVGRCNENSEKIIYLNVMSFKGGGLFYFFLPFFFYKGLEEQRLVRGIHHKGGQSTLLSNPEVCGV